MDENVKYLSSNIFNLEIFTKKEVVAMIENLVKTIDLLMPAAKPEAGDEHVAEMLNSFGLTDSTRDLKQLKALTGKTLYEQLLESMKKISKEDVFANRYLRKYSKEYREIESTDLAQLAKPTLVDLFCGSGGLSLGLAQSGFRVIFANDIEKAALQTYSFNHPEIPGDQITMGGIENISSHIKDYVNEEVDMVAGGPPCQGFSEANRQRLIDDPRNKLYKYYVESVTALQPKVFVMENVKGMLKVAGQVLEDFNNSASHYDIYYKVLNARNFGVPQNRERLIYIGIRKDIADRYKTSAEEVMNQILNKYGKQGDRPLSEALAGLRSLEASRVKNSPQLENEKIGYLIDKEEPVYSSKYLQLINPDGQESLIFNHKSRYNNDRDIEIYGRMEPGDRSDSPKIADIMPYTSRKDIFKDKYFKLIPGVPCKTITAHMKFDCNMYIHPSQARGLTPREAARIQSYPDDFFFQGSFTKTYQQIGNSVPPLLARAIGQELIKFTK